MVKLLKVSLLILIAITMAEAGFYFFVYSKNKSGVTDKPDTVENNIVSVGSDSLDDVVAKDIVKQSLKDIESSGEPLINPQIIEALAKLRRNESHKLTISQEIRGKLASITYHENGTMVLLTIADKNGKTIDVTSIRTDDNIIYKSNLLALTVCCCGGQLCTPCGSGSGCTAGCC